MNKKNGVILVLVLLVGCVLLLLLQKDKYVDWDQTYLESGKNPFDTQVFNDQLSHWFPNVANTRKKLYESFYEYSYDGNLLDSLHQAKTGNYLSITRHFRVDQPSLEELLWYVANGNEAFISADYFSQNLLDTLGITLDSYDAALEERAHKAYTTYTRDTLHFTSKKYYGSSFFKDTIASVALGKIKPYDKAAQTNFIKVPYVDGAFYLHSNPEVFSNYQMLEAPKPNYMSALISYLPKDIPLLQQMNAVLESDRLSESPLRFILSQPALKWAWYVLLVSLVLFTIFNAKRRQRIIPVIEPLKNTTTEFVHSVSTIHYEARDFDGIIKKNIQYFLEHVRSRYFLRTDRLDADFIEKLSLKTGKSKEEIEQLVTLIIRQKSHNNGTMVTLTNLNKKLEKFYQK